MQRPTPKRCLVDIEGFMSTIMTSSNRKTSAAALNQLLASRSKHSNYQELHPCLRDFLGPQQSPIGKFESARWDYMAAHGDFQDKTIIDIGANTGFFCMAAISAGASSVIAIEGNKEHADFMLHAARLLGWQDRFTILNEYYDFGANRNFNADIAICLNVLHHLGDDFGNSHLSQEQACQEIGESLRLLARNARNCWFQMGFNWKGDRLKPLFPRGLKVDLIDFVTSACANVWSIEKVAIYNPATRAYEDANDKLMDRFDDIGEFLNRPLFFLQNLCYIQEQ